MADRAKKATRRKEWQHEAEDARRAVLEQRDRADQPYDPILVPDLEPLKRVLEMSEGEDPYSVALETICGATDDSQPVEAYDGTLGVTTAFVANHERAVAQVQWNANLGAIYTNPGNVSGVRWGSGTMISPDLFLTAGHLFDQTGNGWTRPRVNGTTNTISPQEIATNMHLNFNFQDDPLGNPRTEQSFAITQLIEYRLGGVDFAVCRIAGNPGNTWGWATVAAADAAVNDMLAIIGHPLGLPKRIEAGPLTSFSGNAIQYNDIDTLGGNSGSAILRAASGEVVGVHTNGGCNMAGTGVNFGMRIGAIRANSPTITNLGVATTLLADVLGTAVTADIDPTLAISDKPLWDDIATRFDRDVQPTNHWTDKPIWEDLIGTHLFVDQFNPTKRFDDVKVAGYDDPRVLDPGSWRVNPALLGLDPAAVTARPLILSTQHHSPVLGGFQAPVAPLGGGGMAAGPQSIEGGLARLEMALTQIAAEVDALRAQIGGRGGPTTG